jgi:hypothetical protein
VPQRREWLVTSALPFRGGQGLWLLLLLALCLEGAQGQCVVSNPSKDECETSAGGSPGQFLYKTIYQDSPYPNECNNMTVFLLLDVSINIDTAIRISGFTGASNCRAGNLVAVKSATGVESLDYNSAGCGSGQGGFGKWDQQQSEVTLYPTRMIPANTLLSFHFTLKNPPYGMESPTIYVSTAGAREIKPTAMWKDTTVTALSVNISARCFPEDTTINRYANPGISILPTGWDVQASNHLSYEVVPTSIRTQIWVVSGNTTTYNVSWIGTQVGIDPEPILFLLKVDYTTRVISMNSNFNGSWILNTWETANLPSGAASGDKYTIFVDDVGFHVNDYKNNVTSVYSHRDQIGLNWSGFTRVDSSVSDPPVVVQSGYCSTANLPLPPTPHRSFPLVPPVYRAVFSIYKSLVLPRCRVLFLPCHLISPPPLAHCPGVGRSALAAQLALHRMHRHQRAL